MNVGPVRRSFTVLCKGNASERPGRQSHDQALLCGIWNCALCWIFLNVRSVPRRPRCVHRFLYPLRAASWWDLGYAKECHSRDAGPPPLCGILFLQVIQAYSTLAFLSNGYRNTGEPTAGEPVIVSTCRILTASRGKLKDRGSFVVKSSAEPPGELSDEGETQCCPKNTRRARQTVTKCLYFTGLVK